MNPSLHFLERYYSSRNTSVIQLCNATASSYTQIDGKVTAIINAYARPEFLPLIWEAVQLQTRRPAQTIIIQNFSSKAPPPIDFLKQINSGYQTTILNLGVNLGCWFRFLYAALYCRSPYLVVLDDDTLPGCRAFETALDALEKQDGIYGGRGIRFKRPIPKFWNYEVFGWPVGSEGNIQVDFVGHMWVMKQWWLKELLKHLPEFMFNRNIEKDCGEDMFLSFVAQKCGLATYTFDHGSCCDKWSSIQAYEMGFHENAMSMSGGLSAGDLYLETFLRSGWKLYSY